MISKESFHITLHQLKGLIYFIQMDRQCWHKVRIYVKSGIWLLQESRERNVYQCKVIHVFCFVIYPQIKNLSKDQKNHYSCIQQIFLHDLLFFPLACVMATCQSKKQRQSVNTKNLFTLISIVLSIQSHVKLIILKCQVLCEMHNLKVTKETFIYQSFSACASISKGMQHNLRAFHSPLSRVYLSLLSVKAWKLLESPSTACSIDSLSLRLGRIKRFQNSLPMIKVSHSYWGKLWLRAAILPGATSTIVQWKTAVSLLLVRLQQPL